MDWKCLFSKTKFTSQCRQVLSRKILKIKISGNSQDKGQNTDNLIKLFSSFKPNESMTFQFFVFTFKINSDNKGYLALKYIGFFNNDIIWWLQCIVYQWAETITWKWITGVNFLVKQHSVACGMQISKKKISVSNS